MRIDTPSRLGRTGIVIIGRNEGERLLASLRSVCAAENVVVYVDSGSSDRSCEIAQLAGATVVRLDLTKPFSAARARNAGFAALLDRNEELEFVQFVDGDCELDAGWLKIAPAFLLAHPKIGVVCGRRRERYPERSIYNKLCDMEWDTAIGETKECGGDFLARVKSFQQVDGFSECMIAGEEPELCTRLRAIGWRIWRLEAEMTRHDANIKFFWQWWRRSLRTGYAAAALSRLHGGGPDRLRMRNVTSALAWGGVVPAIIAVGTLCYPPLIAAITIYIIQILRIGLRDAHKGNDGLLYGMFLMLGKFAEFLGIIKFVVARIGGREQGLIEYK